MPKPQTSSFSEKDSKRLRKCFQDALSMEEIANTSKVQRKFLARSIGRKIDKHGIENITPQMIRESYCIITEYVIPSGLENFLRKN